MFSSYLIMISTISYRPSPSYLLLIPVLPLLPSFHPSLDLLPLTAHLISFSPPNHPLLLLIFSLF